MLDGTDFFSIPLASSLTTFNSFFLVSSSLFMPDSSRSFFGCTGSLYFPKKPTKCQPSSTYIKPRSN